MKNVILGAIVTGFVLTFTGHTLANADEMKRAACLETAICYKTDALK
jgi:hypothetical protein